MRTLRGSAAVDVAAGAAGVATVAPEAVSPCATAPCDALFAHAASASTRPIAHSMRRNVINPPPRDELKHRLIGSYVVSGTDPDGKPYAGAGIVDIALAPSGALELDWDNGKQVGVAQLTGDTLVVACLFKGRTAILMMTSNPDGSLAGKWSRRTDRGQKGTETWTKA